MLIQELYVKEEGFSPFYLTEDYQIAQLNYTADQDIDRICDMEVHRNTDELFILTKGKALIIASSDKGDSGIQYISLCPGHIYIVPKNIYHNIVMEPGTEVIIFEKAGTHEEKREQILISSSDLKKLQGVWRLENEQ